MRFSTTLILTITAGLFPLLTIPAVTATPVGLAHGVGPGDAGDILARGIEAGNPTKPMPNIKAVRTVEKRSVEFDSVDSAGLVQRDVGPSGVVLEPAGGTWINTEIGWPTGQIHFKYKPVYIKSNDPDCVKRRDACYAKTIFIAVTLESTTTDAVYSLAARLGTYQGSLIDVYLSVPVEANCGIYRVVVHESQNLYGDLIEFKSAAPQISMTCVRYAGPI